MKVLVAYFSHAGENYGVGYIEKGNTHIIADIIARQLGADMFEISNSNGMIADMGASAAVAGIAVFQAVGEGAKPFLLSLLHKGSLDIVLFFVIRKVFGLEHILWATPTMAAVALIVGIVLVLRLFKTLHLEK